MAGAVALAFIPLYRLARSHGAGARSSQSAKGTAIANIPAPPAKTWLQLLCRRQRTESLAWVEADRVSYVEKFKHIQSPVARTSLEVPMLCSPEHRAGTPSHIGYRTRADGR